MRRQSSQIQTLTGMLVRQPVSYSTGKLIRTLCAWKGEQLSPISKWSPRFWKPRHCVTDAASWARPLVQTPSARCWCWSCQWDDERAAPSSLSLGGINHISGRDAEPLLRPAAGDLDSCQRSRQGSSSFNPSWSELTWHLFISAKWPCRCMWIRCCLHCTRGAH